MTTREVLAKWFDAGVRDAADFMIVVTDTFSYDDFPVYVRGSRKLAAQRAHELEHAPLCKVMEVYDLRGDRGAQLAEARAWAVPQPEPGPHTRFVEEMIRRLTELRGWKA